MVELLSGAANAFSGPQQDAQARQDHELSKLGEPNDRERLRRAAEESISQHLYSIILAIHTAETSLTKSPHRLPAILKLIHTQSEACVEELRHLSRFR